MTQYMLSVHMVEGEPDALRRGDAGGVQGRRRLQHQDQSSRPVGVRRRPDAAETATVVDDTKGGDVHRDRRPVRRGEGAARRLLGRRGPRPRRRARRWPRRPAPPAAARSRSARSRTSTEPDRRPEPVDPSDIERVFRAESGRAVASLVRFFGDIDLAEEAVQDAFVVAAGALARDRAAAQPGRAGSSPPPATGRSTASAASPAATTARPRPSACTNPTNPRRWDRWPTTSSG